MHTILLQSKNVPSVIFMYKELYGESNDKFKFESSSRFCLMLDNGSLMDGLDTVLRFLSKNLSEEQKIKLIGSSCIDFTTEMQIDFWTNKMYSTPSKIKDVILNEMGKQFKPNKPYFLGDNPSLIDIYLKLAINDNPKLLSELEKIDKYNAINSWFNNCLSFKYINEFITNMNNKALTNELQPKKHVLSELPNAIFGQVVTRFPPEASGYLHIGHAKAALLNQLYKEKYNGKLVMRFDDTNPSKENDIFEKIILEDIKLLGLTPDCFTRTSNHFETIMDCAKQLILSGDAYCDDTPAETMKNERLEKIPSKCRTNTIDKNMKMWEEMVKGTDIGQTFCLRAKIDFQSLNGCMRDPTIYRCKQELHLITKNKFKCYPTYDFACPIVDSIENVTHALRTTEYADRDEQYYWFIDKLKLRKPIVCSFSRLNLKYTLLSKRKLTWLVNNRIVDGWDDPRLPTVRGLLRRGMELDALKNFIISQGFSKNVNNMEQEKIWAINKQILEVNAHRFCALNSNELIDATIVNFDKCQKIYECELPFIASNLEAGTRKWFYSSKIFLEKEDAILMKPNDKITLISWGNALVKEIKYTNGNSIANIFLELLPDDKCYKGTPKITWLPKELNNGELALTKLNTHYYGNILKKPFLKEFDNFEDLVERNSENIISMIGESALSFIKKGQKIQILRKGFFICDNIITMGNDCVIDLINIPDGTKKCFELKITSTNKENKLQSNNSETGSEFKNFSVVQLEDNIKEQGNIIRKLKANKVASKDIIQKEVEKLLSLKELYQQKTGKSYQPNNTTVVAQLESCDRAITQNTQLYDEITAQGNKIRQLKSSKAEKEVLDMEVKVLLNLKELYKKDTGQDYKPPSQISTNATSTKSKSKKAKNTSNKNDEKAINASSNVICTNGSSKKTTKLGLEFKKSINFSKWYSELIVKSGLIEYYDIGGCYVLRPQAYGIWEVIQSFIDRKLKERGVKNCYFPMFVSQSALNKEQEHIEDFSPEVAWVTKSGSSDLQEPIAIRPTSETVMYPAFSKWVQSHRDLPLKLNQWCNVVRWEFKHPTPFLRSREFLWQEGHTAFALKDEAIAEVYDILDIYKQAYEELLAVPVIQGRKTEKEKFPGGEFTTTVEAYIPTSGRGIQAATSHHLGQNFSKMFDIVFEDPLTMKKQYVYQNSWGFTTRSIGISIMIHSDDIGLILPPRIVDIQVVIVPCGITASLDLQKKKQLINYCTNLNSQLSNCGIRSHMDNRDNISPGWKFNHYELKGVPLRVEIGPKEVETSSFVLCRRDTMEKVIFNDLCQFTQICHNILQSIQQNLLDQARKNMIDNIALVDCWNNFLNELNKGKLLLAPFCLNSECETQIKDDSSKDDGVIADEGLEGTSVGATMGAKTLCIPFDQPKSLDSNSKCINPKCQRNAQKYVLFGRSY